MNERCVEFITKLVSFSDVLKNAENDVVAYWKPDEPPITTLFAALGQCIYESEDSFSDIELKEIFSLIESVMDESNESHLDVFVATGLLESMSCGKRLASESWVRFKHFAGEKTWNYVNHW